MGTATKMLRNVQELMGELAEEKPMVLAAIIGRPARAVWICCAFYASVPMLNARRQNSIWVAWCLVPAPERKREVRQLDTQREEETFLGMAQVS